MKISENTILITGGGSGIGFETAKLFSELGNTVILTGRNEDKLKAAARKLNHTHYIVADVTKDVDVQALVDKVNRNFPDLTILINNAGTVFLHNVSNSPDAVSIARKEMETNYFAAVNLSNKLLPLLKKQSESAIVNVSSVVAFAPGLSLPTYSASKAALHSYTQALRLSLLPHTNVKVFELMPPLVDTDFAKDIPSNKKISAKEVAEELVQSIGKDRYEIRVASAEKLYKTYLGLTDKAVFALNGLELN
jgi:uncharacterized oxidoreductase